MKFTDLQKVTFKHSLMSKSNKSISNPISGHEKQVPFLTKGHFKKRPDINENAISQMLVKNKNPKIIFGAFPICFILIDENDSNCLSQI